MKAIRCGAVALWTILALASASCQSESTNESFSMKDFPTLDPEIAALPDVTDEPKASGLRAPLSTYAAETSAPTPARVRKVVRDHGYELAWSSYTDGGISGVTGVRDRRDGTFGMRAFLFYNGRFVGTDTSDESEWVGVRPSQGEFVMLLYAYYRDNDAPCEPWREAEVLFGWDGTRLTHPYGSGPPPPSEARSPRCKEER